MQRVLRTQVVLLFVWVILSGIAQGQVPQLINYQGVLIDPATDQPVADATYSISFSIYDVASGGSAIWTETQDVQTKDGLYDVLLGSITPLTPTIFSGPEKYLGIKVGSDPEMMPRTRIVSVAYTILSEDADRLDGKHAAAFADTNHNHDDRYYTESELNTSDENPPNQGSNLISWDNLNDVPAGFADGVDDVNGGGGNTLDQSYDQGGAGAGRTITADAGALNVAGPDGLTVNGNVGIGTTTPGYKLDVNGDAQIQGGNISLANNVSLETSGTSIIARLGGNGSSEHFKITENSGGLVFDVDGNGRAYIQGRVGINVTSATSLLQVKAPYDIEVARFEDEVGNPVVIDSDGKIGIGTANPSNILTIQQNSDTDPIADAWTTYSSKRWKTNIKPIQGALDKVNRLRGVSYDWTADGKHDIGLIAEDVGEIIPEVVAYEENGKDAKSIDYARLVAVLTEAIKEQQKQIEKQQAAIDALMNNNR